MEDRQTHDMRIFDGYRRKTGKKCMTTGFFIFEEQNQILRTRYVGTASIVIRLLLEKFLSGDLPEIEQQLESLKQQSSIS
jgi:hypothetical protein